METFADLLHRASALLVRQRDPEAARRHLERALEMCPDHVTARSLLARCLVELGGFEHALVLFESLELEFGGSVGAKVNVAVVLLKLGRASSARALLECALELAPLHRRAWGYLGVALEQLGLIDEAERAFVAGHHATAARRLRERHAPHPSQALSPDFTFDDVRPAPPVAKYRRRLLLPRDPWSTLPITVSPPDDDGRRTNPPELGPSAVDVVEVMPFESVSRLGAPSPRASTSEERGEPALPLLDAALASLLIAPHEVSASVHHTGLIVVRLVELDSEEGGLIARPGMVHAVAGDVRRERPRHHGAFAPEPFGPSFARFAGTGKLILSPPTGTRLLALEMDADVAFVREDLLVAFDCALLWDLGRIRRSSGPLLSLVRFRGDGVMVVRLDGPFVALDVRDQSVTLRTDLLIGWFGRVVPEDNGGAVADESSHELVTLSGEGTVLFRASHDD